MSEDGQGHGSDSFDDRKREGGKKKKKRKAENDDVDLLKGTTLRIYRFMFKAGKPLGAHEIQRGLDLSSPSIAHYHLKKLLDAGLVKEVESGYVVDRLVFENMIRIRRSFIPLQTTYLIFFSTTLGVLLTILRQQGSFFLSVYIFALVINVVAVGIFAFEVLKSMRKNRV